MKNFDIIKESKDGIEKVQVIKKETKTAKKK